jgi:replication-associated recombination protein RarA
MTPQEKAEDLFMMYVNKGMNQIKPVINRVIRKEMAKQCALIAVDEIIRVLQDEQDWYWQEVKQEIEKL